MPFSEGQTVVHPFHGPVRITCIRERTVRGKPTQYLQLTALGQRLDISVPVDRADEVGLRPVATPADAARLLAILGAAGDYEPQQWSRRLKDLQERLASGRIEQTCVVIREISRSGPKAPASTEGHLLRLARARLATELSLALDVTQDDAQHLIDAALDQSPAALPTPTASRRRSGTSPRTRTAASRPK